MRRAICLASALALSLAIAFPTAAGAFSSNGPCQGIYFSQGTLELPPGYWAEGAHSYSIRFVQAGWPDFVAGPFGFTVSNDAPLYPGQVHLSAPLLKTGYEEVPDQVIDPAQDTVFWSAWAWDMTGAVFGGDPYTIRQAKAELTSASIEFSWDGGTWVVARQGPVTSACANGWWPQQGSGHFQRTFGPST